MKRVPDVVGWIGSGLLLGLAFVSPAFWWSFIPGLVWFLFLIDKENSYKRLFFFSWLAGTVHLMGSLTWFWDTFPLAIFGEEKPVLQLIIISIYWLATAGAMALGTGVFAVCAKRLLRFPLYFLIPFVWCASEVLRSLLYSIYTLGNGGYINANFSFGYLGYVLIEHNFFFLFAKIAGLYALSFVGATLCVFLFVYIQKGFHKHVFKNVGLLTLFVGLHFLIVPGTYEKNIGEKVIVIETYLDAEFFHAPDDFNRKMAVMRDAVAKALEEKPDMIVLPEDSRFHEAFSSQEALYEWAGDTDTIIADSGRTIDERGLVVLRAYMHNLGRKQVYMLDKQYLVPQGEFTPALHGVLLSAFVSEEKLAILNDQQAYRKGLLRDSLAFPEGVPGFLFCFESATPLGVLNVTKLRHPSYVVHPVSHAWFHEPHALWYQFDNMLRVQSVWQNVPVISAGNMTKSVLYTPKGTMEYGEELYKEKYWSIKRFEL